MVPHADDDGAIEGRIGLSVPAPIEAVPAGGDPRRSGDGTRATEFGKGGFRANPVGVIAEEDQHRRRGIGPHPEARSEGGRRRGCEPREVLLVRRDFFGQGGPAGDRVSYETIRQWCLTFGPAYAGTLRSRRGRLGDTSYLDEVFTTVHGQRRYLWRAVDQDGDVLDILVQSRRDRRAAIRFLRKVVKGQGRLPHRLITDKLRSYSAAHRAVMPSVVPVMPRPTTWRSGDTPACTAPGFLDSGLTVFASTLPRPARRGRVAPGRGFDSRISPASTVRCMSA